MSHEEVKPGDVFASGDVSPHSNPGYEPIIRVMTRDHLVALCDRDTLIDGFRPQSRVTARALVPYAVGSLVTLRRLKPVPLSSAELKAYDPNLPLRLLRHSGFNWVDFVELDEKAAVRIAQDQGWDLEEEPRLEVEQLDLWLSLRLGNQARTLRLEGGGFDAASILVRVATKISELGWEAPDGIGIHRLGTGAKGIPWYYVAGYYDAAGHLWRAEHAAKQGTHPEWAMRRGVTKSKGDFSAHMTSLRRDLPFNKWVEKRAHGLEQYTAKKCRAVQRVFTDLIDGLLRLGNSATTEVKLQLFLNAMSALNDLNTSDPELIESGEREELCDWLETIARSADLPDDCLGEEGNRSILAGREW